MIYLMNSAVFPQGSYGLYRYQRASLDDLKAVLAGQHGPWVSTIGYPQNCYLIKKWTGVAVALNRVTAVIDPGDKVLVMRLKQRVADPVSEDPSNWEFAWIIYEEASA